MPLHKSKSYRSYLLRCWRTEADASEPATLRFVVETVSGPTSRWGFERFEDLIAFLRAELLDSDEVKQPPEKEGHSEP